MQRNCHTEQQAVRDLGGIALVELDFLQRYGNPSSNAGFLNIDFSRKATQCGTTPPSSRLCNQRPLPLP